MPHQPSEGNDRHEPTAPEPKPAVNRPSVYVVEFKGSRKEYYRDPYLLPIGNGDFVIVQVERGEDIGRILLKLEPAKESTADIRPLPILRIANDDELARDEARRVGGIGPCGFEQCCTMFLKEFEPITTQLARDQGLSLNPAKISGNCGRLLCCLRYESTYYKEAMRQFPDPGQSWQTADGAGTISDVNVLRDRMTVRLPDGRREHVTLDEIRQSKGKPESWFE